MARLLKSGESYVAKIVRDAGLSPGTFEFELCNDHFMRGMLGMKWYLPCGL